MIVAPGHGLGNTTPNVYDPGASSSFGTEATIVSRVAEEVVDHFFLARDEQCGPTTDISVIPTPECSIACATTHRGRGHLSYLVDWINENAIHSKSAGYGDVVLALHMNSSENPAMSGVLVVVDNGAPSDRHRTAMQISRILAGILGIPDRGVLLDSETPRRSIAIVEKTRPPAYLIELGFVTNPQDVQAVATCGAQAVIAVINRLATVH